MIPREKLIQAAAEGRLPHACFLSSPDNSAAEALARRLAAAFCGLPTPQALEACPDYFEPQAPLRMDPLHQLLGELMKAPFRGHGHGVLFKEAHTMDARLQNVLLKTLEEPPPNTLFLLTGNSAAMLPTVLSRCALLRMGTAPEGEIREALLAAGAGPKEAALYAPMGGGLTERALALFAGEEARALRARSLSALESLLSGMPPFEDSRALAKEKQAPAFLDFLLSFSGDMLRIKLGMAPRENGDIGDRLGKLAAHFTSGQINCMIDAVLHAIQRLGAKAPQGAALDRLFTDILEVIG